MREAHIRAMRRQAEWLEGEAARLHLEASPLVYETLQSLRQRIADLEARR